MKVQIQQQTAAKVNAYDEACGKHKKKVKNQKGKADPVCIELFMFLHFILSL